MDEINPINERDLENEPGYDSDSDTDTEFEREWTELALTIIRDTLISGISKLTSHNQNVSTGDWLGLLVSSGGLRNDLPQEDDDDLLPVWKEFAKALASVPIRRKGYIGLSFMGIQLGPVVSDVLLASFKTLPLQKLELGRNDLGISGFKFVIDALRNCSSLERLHIVDNHILSEHDAISLMKAVREHPNVDMLSLDNCGIGHKNDIMESVVPAASNLKWVSLRNNAIGSYGTGVIAACLARNPVLDFLWLGNNNLDNKDSAKIAISLKSNSNLRDLIVDGNSFTLRGVKAFLGAVQGNSLNECSRSNHTCRIDVGEAYGAVGSHLSRRNKSFDPMLNKNSSSYPWLVLVAGMESNSIASTTYHWR